MIKSRLGDSAVLVGFELPAAVSATTVSVCGDFNDWSPQAHQLTLASDGKFFGYVQLPAGRRWLFRYLLDGERWENDWAADGYVGNEYGSEDSVVDLTDVSALPMAEVTAPMVSATSTVSATSQATAASPAGAGTGDQQVAATRSDAGRTSRWFRRLIGRPA